ncbi:DUF4177 domain-containing protein [uncultured Tateyamaria sp.]|uniref:DUF4177 domain-containing protein n=1 Tax=uncultured Tateyamaria sp. TaxID=455651 RepID=UPI00263410F7|nr:DUF4177 domain-containing protein [uncultured Tateyamaria sp.]
MSAWEYKVVPAPTKGVKGRGIKGPEGRFANALEGLMNEMGGEGWQYQRAETLPSVERSGLTGSTTEWRNVLVFRRQARAVMDDFEPELLPPPAVAETEAEQVTEPERVETPPAVAQSTPEAPAQEGPNAPDDTQKSANDGPKDILDVTASLKGLTDRDNASKSDA